MYPNASGDVRLGFDYSLERFDCRFELHSRTKDVRDHLLLIYDTGHIIISVRMN